MFIGIDNLNNKYYKKGPIELDNWKTNIGVRILNSPLDMNRASIN